jgi:hypothetical protein
MSSRIAVLMALASGAIYAQTVTTGDITGAVTDSSVALVPNAAVMLKSVDTGESRLAISSVEGVYRFTFVRPGTYEIYGASAGLKSDTSHVTVAVGQVRNANLSLHVEGAKSVVLVTDVAPLLDTGNANITYTVSSRQLDLLPLPGGDLVAVAYSVPGVVLNNRYGTGNFAAGGVGSVSNLFTVNGVEDMDPYSNVNNSGTTGLLLGANEVSEASVVQNAYEGQYGRQAGLQVNYVTRSGSNAWHGNLAYSYSSTGLVANDFFANASGTPRPHMTANQYAAALGGHIVRNRLFFFADTEGLRNGFGGSGTVVVPSPAFESYSLRTIQPSQAPLYRKMFDLYNAAPGHERGVAVGNGIGPLQDSSGRLGCGRLAGTPTGTGGIFGTDVSCAQAWGSALPNDVWEWLLSTRVDYNLNAKQRLFLRFKTNQGYLMAGASNVNPVFNRISYQPDYEGQVNHTFTISPRLVNNFIGAVTYNSFVYSTADLDAAFRLFPFRFTIMDGGSNGSRIAPLGINPPSGRRAGQLQIVDDVSYNVGGHLLKAGVNYRYDRESDLQYDTLEQAGQFNFRRLDELANGALLPNSGSNYFQRFSTTPVLHLRLYNLGVYVQDQWAIRPYLRVTATVRFDRNGNPYCLDHCFARLTSPFADLNKGLSIPYNQSIQSGLSHAFYGSDAVTPQPRASFVYNPSWSKGTVFRGGIGLFADLYPAYFNGTMAGNAPNVFAATIRTGMVNTAEPGSTPAIAAASAGAFRSWFADGATLAQLQQAVAPAAFTPPMYYSLPSTLQSPRFLQWSLEVQRQIGASNVVTVRYQGNHGYDIFLDNPNVNASADPAQLENGFAGLPAAAPDPRFAVVTQMTNNGYSNYHALTASFRRGFGRGLQGQIAYTWSHALDTISSGGLSDFSYDSVSAQINPFSVRSLNYSNADYDTRHNLVADLVWEVPAKFTNRLVRAAFGRWSVGTRLNARGGTPFTVINSAVGGNAGFGGTVLAEVMDPKIRTVCGRFAIDRPCFTVSQFAPSATQTDLGNLQRNSFRGPGLFNIDLSLWKPVLIRERMRLTLGASAYNLLNHPSFGDPNADVASGGLGLIKFTAPNPSGPFGWYGGPSGRAVVVTGRFAF